MKKNSEEYSRLMVSDVYLRDLQRALLEILVDIHDFCEVEGINYILTAGTLLGAVRHEGFIPWDDDIDIGMLREDYEIFIANFSAKFAGKYFVQTSNSDKFYGLPFAKIRKEGTTVIEHLSRNCKHHTGIFVDLFPFDSVPNNICAKSVQAGALKFANLAVQNQVGYSIDEYGYLKGRRFLLFFTEFISKVFSRSSLVRFNNYVATFFNKESDSRIVFANGGPYGYRKESIKKEWIINRKKYRFEDKYFWGPNDYDGYLQHLYGNYRELPPLSARTLRHGYISIDLGA
jgi:lipopolysaccharide cholinephosphotransferase